MGKTHIFFTDVHCSPGRPNDHAVLLGKLINDVKPDVLICGGDLYDMESLCTYDKGTRGAVGRNYSADCDAGKDFNERLLDTIRKRKRKMPRRVFLIGNHEQRIDRALDVDHHLVGTIGYEDLDLFRYYNEVVGYEGQTPGIIEIDGILYAHYFVSGAMGRPIHSVHQAAAMLAKNMKSSICGHTHVLDYSRRSTIDGKPLSAISGGCFVNYEMDWPGYQQSQWWRGVVILRNVEDGDFDPEFVSLERLREVYGE